VLNQAGAMTRLMQEINRVAEEVTTSVLLITHNAKSTDDVAGSFTIRATAKHILRLGTVQGMPPSRSLKVEGKLIESFLWSLTFGGPGAWKLDDKEAANIVEVEHHIGQWLQQGNRGTAEEIARAVNRRTNDVRTALGLLQDNGTAAVESVHTGKAGRPSQVYTGNFSPDHTDQ